MEKFCHEGKLFGIMRLAPNSHYGFFFLQTLPFSFVNAFKLEYMLLFYKVTLK